MLMTMGFLLGVMKLDCGDGYTTLNILKSMKLDTLNGQLVWYMSYISIKLLPKKSETKEKETIRFPDPPSHSLEPRDCHASTLANDSSFVPIEDKTEGLWAWSTSGTVK